MYTLIRSSHGVLILRPWLSTDIVNMMICQVLFVVVSVSESCCVSIVTTTAGTYGGEGGSRSLYPH